MFFLMLAGAGLLSVVFLQMTQFQWLGVPFLLPATHLNTLMFLGLLLLAVGFRSLPENDPKVDLSRWVAYPLLAVVFAAAAWLRFYRINEPFGYYWDDPANCIMDPRNALDLHDYRILYPIGSREPLYTYVAAAVWSLIPWAKAIFIQRLAANLFNLLAIWILYRLGREVSGKRLVGLLLAAMVAASKPVLLQNLCGMNGLTLTFSVGLALLTQVKLFKKPNLAHFLEWGAALALGLYTYNAIRTWLPFLAVVSLGWILWKGKEEAKKAWVYASALVFFALYLGFFLDKMLFMGVDNPVSKLFGGSFSIWFFWQALFLVLLVQGYRLSKGANRQLCAWALGLLLAGVLSYPMALLPDAAKRIGSISLIPKQTSQIFTSQFFNLMVTQFESAVKALFIWGDDRADMNVIGDPFFDFQAVIFTLIGLVWTLIRPSWWKTFFFFCVWVGMVPRLLTSDPQSAKLLGALPALLLLAAMGLGRWIEGAWGKDWKNRWMGLALVLGLAAFWGWEVRATYLRVYEKWWYVQSDDVRLGQEISKDLPDKRVYASTVSGFGYMSPATQGVLHDGQDLYLFQNVNVIDVRPGAPRQDVVVFVSPRNQPVVDLLKKDFPKAQWSSAWQYYQTPGQGIPFTFRALIPADQIPEKPGKCFQFQVVPGNTWMRRIYVTYFGLCHGMIEREDLSPTLNPLTTDSGAHSNSAEGVWEAPADGDYTLSVFSPDTLQVWIDGNLALGFKAVNGAQKVAHTVFLKKGPHEVRYLAFLKMNLRFPDVTIKNQEANYTQVLGSQ